MSKFKIGDEVVRIRPTVITASLGEHPVGCIRTINQTTNYGVVFFKETKQWGLYEGELELAKLPKPIQEYL